MAPNPLFSSSSQFSNSTSSEKQPLTEFDVIVIGSGIGGLVTATQLAVKGARVLVLERYVIPGGSAGYFERSGLPI